MANFNIETDRLSSEIETIARQLSDPRPQLQQIGEYMLLTTRDRFDRETDPSGKAWAPLAAATIRAKQRKKALSGILTETGTLRDTITYQVQGNDVLVGTPLNYGQYHQFSRRRPMRQFLGVNDDDRAEILAIFKDALR
jgi:phage virion morphogenesis protein